MTFDFTNAILLISSDGASYDIRQAADSGPVGRTLLASKIPRDRSGELDFLNTRLYNRIAGFYLTGIESPADIEKMTALIRVIEARQGLADGSHILLAEISTAKSVLSFLNATRKIPGLAGLVFASSLLAEDIRAQEESEALKQSQALVALAAKAMGVEALMVADGEKHMEHALKEGFCGLVIRK